MNYDQTISMSRKLKFASHTILRENQQMNCVHQIIHLYVKKVQNFNIHILIKMTHTTQNTTFLHREYTTKSCMNH